MANMASACALVMSTGDSSKLFGPLRHWRAKEAASTCILVTISAVCVCILVVCGVLLAREYSLAKGYERTSCTVSNVTDSGQEKTCQCAGHKDKTKDKSSTPGGCIVSSFPCIRVSVLYSVNAAVHEALLHLDSIQAVGLYRECSFNVCGKDKEDNYKAAHEFADRWRNRLRGDPFECYYNTVDYDDVIAEKVYTQSDVIHSMLWPSLVIVVCCAVFLRLETRRRHLTFCGRAPPENSTECSRGPTPDALDMHVVFRGGPTGSGFRFPGANGSVECRLVARMECDKKPWKSYSSLEQLIATPRRSVTVMQSRDAVKHVTELKSRSADLLLDEEVVAANNKSKLNESVESGVQLRIDDELTDDHLNRKMSVATVNNPVMA